jgi:hypothetical protein
MSNHELTGWKEAAWIMTLYSPMSAKSPERYPDTGESGETYDAEALTRDWATSADY